MNFKSNGFKIILSIVLAIIGNTFYWYTFPAKGGLLVTESLPVAIMTLVSPIGLIYLLSSIAVIYILVSLIQKVK